MWPSFSRLVIGFLLSIPCIAAAVTPGGSASTLVITQSVTGPTEGVISTVAARQGNPQNSANLMTMDIGGRKIANVTGIPQLAVVDYGTAMKRSQLSQAARTHIVGLAYPSAAGAVDALVTALQTYMQTMRVGAVAFNFNQRVVVTGDPAPKYLIWSLVLQQGQKPLFPDPQIIDTVPTILQVTYTPLNVARGLPAAWAYPNAGALQWRKLDAAYSPITSWSVVDVGGAYDQPEDLSGAAVDKDQGLKCLVNRASSADCPSATNVLDLLDQTGAGYAMLDYGRTLQPVYDSVETPPNSGQFQQVAHAVLSVDYRELNISGCAAGTFTNKGTYGFALHNQVDRYAVWSNGTYRQLNSFTSNTISPTSPFDVSKSGLVDATVTSLADKVIDLSNPPAALLVASTIPNLLSLAPITVISGAEATQVVGVYYYGECGRSFGIKAQCDVNGNIQLQFGVSSDVPNCPFGTGFYQDQTYTLKRGAPVASQTSALDYAGSFSWSYDGDRSVVFKHSDGLMSTGPKAPVGMSVFASQMFFPNVGYYVKQNFPTGGPVNFYFERSACPSGALAGEALFTPERDDYHLLVGQCFNADSNGSYLACPMVNDYPTCGTFSPAGSKVWIPAQY